MEARALLEDDDHLREFIWEASRACIEYANDISKSLSLFQLLLNSTNSAQKKEVQRYDLYSRILFGDFIESPLFREVLLFVKKMPSESLQKFMAQYLSDINNIPELDNKVATILPRMQQLSAEKEKSQGSTRTRGADKTNNTSTGLISEFDITNDSVRTTVLSGRVRLDEWKKRLTPQDLEYSNLVKNFTESLESHFKQTLVGLDKIFLNEVMFYDIDSLHGAVSFTLKPRKCKTFLPS